MSKMFVFIFPTLTLHMHGANWTRNFSWLLGNCHLVIRFWTKSLTYLFQHTLVRLRKICDWQFKMIMDSELRRCLNLGQAFLYWLLDVNTLYFPKRAPFWKILLLEDSMYVYCLNKLYISSKVLLYILQLRFKERLS